MNIDWQIVQALTLITGIFFTLGVPLKWKIPQVPFFCLPAAGMIFFGGLIVPILYFSGGWRPDILYGVFILFLGVGLVSLFFIIKGASLAKPTLFSVIALILFVLLTIGFVIQSSKYPVPGGIDPAIHTAYISNIVQFNNFNTSYPLGMHIFILFIENISSHLTPTILLALQIFFIINIFILTYYSIKKISGNNMAGMIGVSVAVLDVSIYNNYLNGSITHLLAILLTLVGIVLILLLSNSSKRLNFLVIIVFYVSVFYFHFITLFMLIPVLWFLRINQTSRQHWLITAAFPISLLIAAPLLVNFLDIPGFQVQFAVACLIFLLVEVVILFFSSRIKKMLFNVWVQLLFVIIGLFAFENTLKVFDVIQEWYGLFILSLAIIGIILIILRRMHDWYPIVMYFSIFSILYYLIEFALEHINSPIFRELLFYYGFTVPLTLLAAAGLYFGLQLVSSKTIKASVLAALFVVIILIFSSRSFDNTFLSDSRAISRYGQNNGFGMFYSYDDIRVVRWAKEHIPRDAGIINPGGLYNAWASITQRKTMYSAYVVVNSQEPEETNQAVIDLLTNNDQECPRQLIKQKYQYLLLPSQFVANFLNPCVGLLYQSGTSRLYQIHNQPINATINRMINLSDSTKNKEISISGNFRITCAYCGNRFYFQFQNVVHALTLPARGTLLIMIAPVDADRRINLRVDGPSSMVNAIMTNPEERSLKFSNGYILQDFVHAKGEQIQIQLKNTSGSNQNIQAIMFEVL
ncbi:hypothetical protein EPN15_01010 [Patescibacteria group bacterium]|nr:MAG: hypothetical protein EPN15_01010 [Patescibacteria group bacterium]